MMENSNLTYMYISKQNSEKVCYKSKIEPEKESK